VPKHRICRLSAAALGLTAALVLSPLTSRMTAHAGGIPIDYGSNSEVAGSSAAKESGVRIQEVDGQAERDHESIGPSTAAADDSSSLTRWSSLVTHVPVTPNSVTDWAATTTE
jgi:hypothetical protein